MATRPKYPPGATPASSQPPGHRVSTVSAVLQPTASPFRPPCLPWPKFNGLQHILLQVNKLARSEICEWHYISLPTGHPHYATTIFLIPPGSGFNARAS